MKQIFKNNTQHHGARLPGMESLTELYKVGSGPSSSHTIGPERACLLALKKFPAADEFRVTLFGSLAKTGKGHGTDTIIRKTLYPMPCEIIFAPENEDIPHPNTMDVAALSKGHEFGRLRIMSVGGGRIQVDGEAAEAPKIHYTLKTWSDIRAYCEEKNIRLWQFAEENEGP